MVKIAQIEHVTTESIKKHTGKNWDYWIQHLNKRGYQVHIGARIPHQTLKGTYTTTATKSITASANKIYKFMVSPEGQKLWLQPLSPARVQVKKNFECAGGIFGEFRTLVANQRMRFTWINEDWPNKTTVQLHLHKKPNHKCMLVINHNDLPTLRSKNQMHAYWREAVDAIAASFKAI